MEITRKCISVDLTIGEQVHIGNKVATILDIQGDEVTVAIEDIEFDNSDQCEDLELKTF